MQAQIDRAEQEADRAENLITHEAEIAARPARTWYQTETQKKEVRELSREVVKQEQKAAAAAPPTAKERAAALARADDYRSSDAFSMKDKTKGPKDKDGHRLSRKKRRRMEALEELAQESGHGRGGWIDYIVLTCSLDTDRQLYLRCIHCVIFPYFPYFLCVSHFAPLCSRLLFFSR